MSKKLEQAEKAISKYEELLKRQKVILAKQKARVKLKTKREARKAREHRIYTLGGKVEKMGLDQADEKFLLGLFWFGNQLLAGKSADGMSGLDAEYLRLQGEAYLIDGVKMDRPSSLTLS